MDTYDVLVLSRYVHDIFEENGQTKVISSREQSFNLKNNNKTDLYSIIKNGILKKDLSTELRRGSVIYEAHVNWSTYNMDIFLELDEIVNNTPSYSHVFHIYSEDKPCFKQMTIEVFMFLKRGHSWMHPCCTCDIESYYRSASRLKLIGYENKRANRKRLHSPLSCDVESDHTGQTLVSIERELGIKFTKIEKDVCNKHSFLQHMLKYGNFTLSEIDGQYAIHSAICCVPKHIKSIADLETAAKIMHPRPFLWKKNHGIMCLSDTQLMHEAKLGNVVAILESSVPDHYAVFYTYFAYSVKTDQDVKELWKKHRSIK